MKDVIQIHFSSAQSISLIEKIQLVIKSNEKFEKQLENLQSSIKNIANSTAKSDAISSLIVNNIHRKEHFHVLKLALNLIRFKDYILEKSKLTSETFRTIKTIHILDFAYDYNMLLLPYSVRVAGALLIKILFEDIAKNQDTIYLPLIEDISEIPYIDPDTILQIIYAESASQSIRSTSGSSYEERVKDVLITNGIQYISQSFDSNLGSIEYDFKLTFQDKSIGVSAKRTLRERYKQNHESIENLDVDMMFLITLGIDLNEDKVKYITQKEGHYIFVANDIFSTRSFLTREKKVYPINELTNELIKTLLKI
ncbi:hypothetical protein [Arcicella aurantiaca]|nr:hypothetical protein [Arcicella aurantiaca]